MKQKFELSIFDTAAEHCSTRLEYACLALEYAQERQRHHRELFEALFLTEYTTFAAMHKESFGTVPSDEELQNIRVMAICLAREIARLKNNKKNSGFSPAEVKRLVREYEKNSGF